MAEAFGVAAGAIGVASFSLQLVESVQKLKQFCTDVKNAPDELQEITEEISMWSDQLQHLSAFTNPSSTVEAKMFQQCLDLCQKAVKKISDAATALQEELVRKKNRTRVKIVLNRETLDRHLKKLDRGRGLLQVAHQTYVSAQCRDQLDQLASQQRFLKDIFKNQVVVVQSNNTITNDQTMYHPSSTPAAPMPKACNALETRQKPFFRIRSPGWLTDCIWDLALSRSLQGWTLSLRQYNVRAHDTVRAAIWEDDVQQLRDLLVSGKATIYDEITGASLYENAIMCNSQQTLRFLENSGAARTVSTEDDFISSMGFHSIYSLREQPIDVIQGQMSCHAHYIQHLMPFYDGSNQDVARAILVLTTTARPPKPELSLEIIEHTFTLFTPIWLESKSLSDSALISLLELALGDANLEPESFDLKDQHESTLAHHVTLLLSRVHWEFDQESDQKPDQKGVIKADGYLPAVLKSLAVGFAKADLHAEDDSTSTPLHYLLLVSREADWGDKGLHMDYRLRLWIELLAIGGVDLVKYGEWEVANLRQLRLSLLEDEYGFELLQLESYGPNISDWKIQLDLEAVYAHDFLEFAEKTESMMPGTWVW